MLVSLWRAPTWPPFRIQRDIVTTNHITAYFLLVNIVSLRVNVDTYEALLEMGFTKKIAASALRQANNDVNKALQVRAIANNNWTSEVKSFSDLKDSFQQVLQDHPEMLDLPDDRR